MAFQFKSSIGAGISHPGHMRNHLDVDYANSYSSSGSVTLYRSFGKRVLDLFLLFLAAPIALVLIAVTALATLLMDGHRPFFRQRRIGRDGRVFWLLKIRTMVPDAEARLEAHLAADPAARREWDEKQKLDDDPRITRLGAFLRKCSLDELPQLWNVLKGDMSLVGPRPMMVEQRKLYPGRSYFELRPGITGNWQVSDRNETSFAARAEFDDRYEAGLSLGTDLDIIRRTVGVILRCTGR